MVNLHGASTEQLVQLKKFMGFEPLYDSATLVFRKAQA